METSPNDVDSPSTKGLASPTPCTCQRIHLVGGCLLNQPTPLKKYAQVKLDHLPQKTG